MIKINNTNVEFMTKRISDIILNSNSNNKYSINNSILQFFNIENSNKEKILIIIPYFDNEKENISSFSYEDDFTLEQFKKIDNIKTDAFINLDNEYPLSFIKLNKTQEFLDDDNNNTIEELFSFSEIIDNGIKKFKKDFNNFIIIFPSHHKNNTTSHKRLIFIFNRLIENIYIELKGLIFNFKSEISEQKFYKFIIAFDGSEYKEFEKSINPRLISSLSESVAFAKTMIQCPPNIKTTTFLLSEYIKFISNTSKNFNISSLKYNHSIHISVLDEEDLLKNNLQGIYSVGKASKNNSKLLIIDYCNNQKENESTIVLVGKGVIFDSGGINLKPNSGLKNMKKDMAGSAVIIGVMRTLIDIELPIRLISIIPIVENSVSANAMRPSDIIEMNNGKYVEITNTDAEGRLILADSISYSIKKYDPDLIIDVATLTGSSIIALGKDIAAIFSNNNKLSKLLQYYSNLTGEKCWSLPLPKSYCSNLLKSKIADIKSTGGKYAGSITAALFLKNFINNNKNWIHLDIAGPGIYDDDNVFGIRLLSKFIKDNLQKIL
jgi:leucyl aminopeptidase